jgi:hypothetical protein
MALMRMNISVPDALAEEVRRRDLPISAICQRALRDEVARAQTIEATADIVIVGSRPGPDPRSWPDFTLGKPYLTYGRNQRHGDGWTLWYQLGSQPIGNIEEHFIPGESGDLHRALDVARDFLRRAREGVETITVEIGEPSITVGFQGRWLVEPDPDRTRTGKEGHDAGTYWGVALTRRGRIAVYLAHCNARRPTSLRDYDTLNDAVDDGLPADIVALAAAEMAEEFTLWRDI